MQSLIATLFLLVALVIAPNLTAQVPPPCTPDCFGSPFGPTQVIVITTASGCTVRVWYASRLACGVWRDVAIQQVEIIGYCGLSASDLLDEIANDLWTSNPMGFPVPDTGTCDTVYRVTKAQCWRMDTTDCDGDTLMLPCGGLESGCCLVQYEICLDSVGTKVVRPISASIPVDTCIVPPGARCENVCTVPHNKTRPLGNIRDDEHQHREPTTATLSVIPNPASEDVTIRVTGMHAGTWSVRIAESTGRVVATNVLQVGANGTGELHVASGALHNGAHAVYLSNGNASLNTVFLVNR
jgi:hypothetical protein